MKPQLESKIQRDIEIAIGCEPGLILLRNSVGRALHIAEKTGNQFRVPYGLGVGTPDLVGLLTAHTPAGPLATWFCLEVKQPGKHARPEQRHVIELWRTAGAFVEVVESVIQARAALACARESLRKRVAS